MNSRIFTTATSTRTRVGLKWEELMEGTKDNHPYSTRARAELKWEEGTKDNHPYSVSVRLLSPWRHTLNKE